MQPYRDVRPVLLWLVRLQAGLCFLVGAAGGLWSVASSRGQGSGDPWAGLGVAIGLFVLTVGLTFGIVLLVALHGARRGSPIGRACLACVEVLVLMVALAFASGSGLRSGVSLFYVLLVLLDGSTLVLTLAENTGRRVPGAG